jgi:hypothetical protein
MNNGNGSGFDILAKANSDLLHKLRRVKLENEKSRRNNPTNPGNTNVGNFQRLDRQRKKVEENKGVQNTDIRKVKASKKGSMVRQNNNHKRPVKSTMENQVQGSTVDQQASKKRKTVPKCPAVPITEYLNKNKEQGGVDELDDEDIEESEMGEDIEKDMNYEGEEIEGTNVNTAEGNISIDLIGCLLV